MPKPTPVPCPQCTRTFYTYAAMLKHTSHVHGAEMRHNLTISIPDSLADKIRLEAADKGTSFNEAVNCILRSYFIR